MGSDKLWKWTAVELAEAIRTKKVSSREVTLSCLNRIEEVNPKVNALVEVSSDEALASADAADRAISAGKPLGSLHGVPVSIKVNTDEAGHATTEGLPAFKDNVVGTDSPQVANLRKAGAIFVGRSNTPSFSFRWFTNNELHGKTLNPWNNSRTPGGSSGGAAASVATGMTPIAHGNDLAGSLRYPAYACGVTTIRPTVGRVPSWSSLGYSLSIQSMGVQGPIARTVGDLRLALASMSRFDPGDPAFVPAPLIGKPLPRPIRVGLLRDVGIATPTSAVNKALDEAADRLSDAGYIVEEVELPLFDEAFKLWHLLCLEDFRQAMPLVEQFGDEEIKQSAKNWFTVNEEWWGEAPQLSDILGGYQQRGALIVQLQQFLEKYPLLLLPNSAEQAFEQDADIISTERTRHVVVAQWPMIAVALFGVPAISVPTSVEDGLPMGVQIVGRKFREDTLFEAAEIIEAHASIATPIDPR
ncbi:amidase family protein [Sporosarcina sp. FSL W7-1349]|uniref:amidase family protein n=1 Tax=Sporosarcina sp. FSL W7-1349 TaxID=2921561 RepID=UPI0030FB5229